MAALVLNAVPVNAAFQSALSNDIVAEHPELWSGVGFRIMDDRICYELMVILIAIGTSMKCCYSSKSFPSFLQGITRAIFQQDNAHPHIAKTVRDFCSVQHMQLFTWTAHSPDMLPIEHAWDLVDRRLARDERPAASKGELWLHIEAIRNSLPPADIQKLVSRRIVQQHLLQHVVLFIYYLVI